MTELWVTIIAVAIANSILKGAGPALAGDREFSPRMNAAISLLAPALLVALVLTGTFGEDGALVIDERALGLGSAAITLALALGVPLLLAVALAAVVTALARLLV